MIFKTGPNEISISQGMMKQNVYVHICGLNVATRNYVVDRYVPLTWKRTKIYDFIFV